ncbi:hypothetical protein WJX81_007574 [Elliptochloris bilobata]|uniref:Uncharacterized protein n=1 Tax=Elliptochloris bilobata TaxID=381761 RepID=A0AAW1RRJ4_9CHLO
MASKVAESDAVAKARADLEACVFKHSWLFCVGGVTLSVPLCIRIKSYLPLLALGAAGTLFDELNSFWNCAEQRQALLKLQAQEAGNK